MKIPNINDILTILFNLIISFLYDYIKSEFFSSIEFNLESEAVLIDADLSSSVYVYSNLDI